MRIKNIVLSVVVAVGASINVYIANDIHEQRNDISLLTLENIANADEHLATDCKWTSGKNEKWECVGEDAICRQIVCPDNGDITYCLGTPRKAA